MQEEMQEKILRNIAKNGKLSTEDLAAMLAASPEEIEKEMNAMEEQGIICGYPTLINWDKTGCEHVYVSPTKNRLRGAQAVNALCGYISP